MTPESLSLIEPKTAKPRSATDCPRCDAWWTGLNTAQNNDEPTLQALSDTQGDENRYHRTSWRIR